MSSENDNINNNNNGYQLICPSAYELSTIINQVICKECNLVFSNESRFRMHDLKVHKKTNLVVKRNNVKYHCPAENCVYALGKHKHFTLHKYLKQHYLKVHAEKKFSCTKCTKSFSTNSAKEAHTQICGTKFVCECQKLFNSYEALLTHAKRHLHNVDKNYKLDKSRSKTSNRNLLILYSGVLNSQTSQVKPILPKPTCDASSQTDETLSQTKPRKSQSKGSKICRQTQTVDKKNLKKSAETQTIEPGKKSSPEVDSMKLILPELWEEKNFEDYRTSRSDPMLTEESYSDKFSQTEKEYCRSIFDPDTETLQVYSNTCTQTCNEFDLELTDIQTQTAWESIDESTAVSTETQTKAIKCLAGCDWFTIQTNHMETQTDLLSIFQDLE